MRLGLVSKIVLALLGVFSLVELVSRYYGLNSYPLFEESKEFEYIHKPNQNVSIYGNKFITNEFSMRSEPVDKQDTLVVLLIGDSVVNGGNQVDHEDLASTRLEKKLKAQLNKPIRVLNISSYTWGPDNIFAYLKKYGTFNADLFVMVNNSGDAYDNMTFRKVVGIKSSFPAKNYSLASVKLISKIIDTIKNKFKKTKNEDNEPGNREFNSGFENINLLARQLNVPLIIYMHASQKELQQKKYTDSGERIISFFENRNRKVIKELNYPLKKKMYLDDIHFNKDGQFFMYSILYDPIYNIMKNFS